jgi:hypothetical protein
MSLAAVVLVIESTGVYCPSAPILKLTATSLKPVTGERFQEPWYVMYIVLESASNLQSIGAEWGKRVILGATAFWLQVSSLKVPLGVGVKKSPTLKDLSVKSDGCQTVKPRWVAVPVIIGLGDIANVVNLLARVVLMDVLGLTVDSALEVVTTILYAPEPIK